MGRKRRAEPYFGIRQQGIICAVLYFAASPIVARGQVVERNLPWVVRNEPSAIGSPPLLASSTDATPLGVDLSGVRLLGPAEPVEPRPGPGVVIGSVGSISRDALRGALSPMIGCSLSRKLISDAQAAIVGVYRQAGYPLVSVIAPPQELTAGVLQLRVIEFRYGDVAAKGPNPADARRARDEVRATTGDRISASLLDEDIDWINRYPYHNVQGVFSPGNAVGSSNLTLDVTESKPWQVYAGYANTGTTTTGLDRWFTGAAVGLPAFNEAALSYQFTASDDFFTYPGSTGQGPYRPGYVGGSARLSVPTFARQSLEIVPSFTETRSTTGLVDTDENIFELPILYHFALSNVLPSSAFGELVVGPSFKTLTRQAFLSKTPTSGGSANLFEMTVGWADHFADALGRTNWQVSLVGDPGGVLGGNTNSTWSVFTNGRVENVQYVYAVGTVNRITNLPGGFFLTHQLSGLAADTPLPDTEQLPLGGLYAVRGYQLDDSNVDVGFTLRNELRTPVFPFITELTKIGIADQLSPFAFVDYGWGKTFASGTTSTPVPAAHFELASVGFGVDYNFANNLSANLVAGYALHSALVTRSGDWSFQARVSLMY